jgi:hypothetical protein
LKIADHSQYSQFLFLLHNFPVVVFLSAANFPSSLSTRESARSVFIALKNVTHFAESFFLARW